MKVPMLSIKFRLVADADAHTGRLISVQMRYNPRHSPLAYVDKAANIARNRNKAKLVKFYGYTVEEREV